MKLYPPIALPPAPAHRLPAALPGTKLTARPEAAAEPGADADADLQAPLDWQRSYQRRQAEEPVEHLPTPCLSTLLAPLAAVEWPQAQALSATGSDERVQAAQQAVECHAAAAELHDISIPAPRSWQLDLPMPGAPWQLRVEQALPSTAVGLQLSVPATVQAQARHHLAQLDKRLREAGHAHQRLRCEVSATPAERRLRPDPIDEVGS